MTLLTVAEVAERLRLSRSRSVHDLIHRGDLVASKVLGRWLVAEDDLEAFIAATRNVARRGPASSRGAA